MPFWRSTGPASLLPGVRGFGAARRAVGDEWETWLRTPFDPRLHSSSRPSSHWFGYCSTGGNAASRPEGVRRHPRARRRRRAIWRRRAALPFGRPSWPIQGLGRAPCPVSISAHIFLVPGWRLGLGGDRPGGARASSGAFHTGAAGGAADRAAAADRGGAARSFDPARALLLTSPFLAPRRASANGIRAPDRVLGSGASGRTPTGCWLGQVLMVVPTALRSAARAWRSHPPVRGLVLGVAHARAGRGSRAPRGSPWAAARMGGASPRDRRTCSRGRSPPADHLGAAVEGRPLGEARTTPRFAGTLAIGIGASSSAHPGLAGGSSPVLARPLPVAPTRLPASLAAVVLAKLRLTESRR